MPTGPSVSHAVSHLSTDMPHCTSCPRSWPPYCSYASAEICYHFWECNMNHNPFFVLCAPTLCASQPARAAWPVPLPGCSLPRAFTLRAHAHCIDIPWCHPQFQQERLC
uniref:Uncharacterized protein n=1 Tax=Knipowitschia caucasica TaxID=637954 RepID=A0AAV2K6S1_KNICA